MKMILYNTGKTDVAYIRQGVEDYTRRIKRFINFSVIDLPAVKHTRNTPPEELAIKEGENIIHSVSASSMVVLLDENGQEFNTHGFSNWLERNMNKSLKSIAFVTGGAYGFSEPVFRLADAKIALSRMTFTHQMVRLIFVEQLYRALTIVRGVPYHND